MKEIDRLSPEERRALLESTLRKKAEQPRSGPLSFGQRALWFVHEIAPESAAYTAPLSVRVRSAIDAAALKRAAKKLILRHAALRTTFVAKDGAPVAVTRADTELDFQERDVAGWTDEKIREELTAEAHRPFDLERGPLFRVVLLSRATNEHFLLVTAHHIAVDLWSLVLIVEELGAFYAAETHGARAQLPPVRFEYADYVRQEAEIMSSTAADRLVGYWQKKLGGALPTLELPSDRRRPKVLTFCGATEDIRLSAELTRALRALAKEEETTLNTVLLAAFHLLLHRSSGQEDIIVGSPTSGRDRPEYADIVGYFVNPIALRGELSGNPPFRAFLRQVRQTMLEAIEHQAYPFPLLVEKLHPDRDTGRSPIFQALFVLQQVQRLEGAFATLIGFEGARATIGGLECEPFALPRHSSQFDIELMMMLHEGSIWGSFQYSTDLFDAATVRRMAQHFEILLWAIVKDPNQPLLALPFLAEDEKKRLLEDFNATRADFPAELCLHQLFERRVAESAEDPAVIFGGERLSYQELNRRANQLAHHLQQLGVRPETPVAIAVERSLEMIVGVMAIEKAGGAYVPLDPTYPVERLRYMIEHATAPILLTKERYAANLILPDVRVVCFDIEADAEAISRQPETNPISDVRPENLAYIIYTSGSTGQPKGVAIEHQSAVNTICDMNQRFRVGPLDRTLMLSSLSFDLSVYDIFGLLAAGGAVVLPEIHGAKEPAYWAETAKREKVTLWNTVPALMDMLVGYCAGRPGIFPSSLRLVWMSGDFIPLALPEAIRSLIPHAEIISLGGATEGSIWSIIYPIGAVDPSWESIPYGSPLKNQTYFVLNDALEPCAIGVPGMLYIGGTGVARGYFRDKEKTSASFIIHPRTQQRIYRTGDLGRYRSYDQIEILGRADSQVKIRGYRIELGEIEAALAKHPALLGAVVIAQEEAKRGRLGKRLIAYVKAPESSAPSADDLRAFLRSELPEYMVPAIFVRLDAFPLSQNGKVDRRALPAPSRAAEAQDTFLPPSSEIETVLAGIWRELLGLDQVGVNDNFFDLGGHSLLMARAQSRIKEALGREVRIVELFEHPTIGALARHLDPSSSQTSPQESEGARLRLRASERRKDRTVAGAIAIIGYAGRFPGAADVEALWRNLRDAKESISFFSDEELIASGVPRALIKDPNYVRAAGVLDGADSFDPGFFGYNPRDAELMDPQHGLMLECAEDAFANAGYDPHAVERRVGVFAGAAMPSYFLGAFSQGAITDPLAMVLGHDKDFLTTRVSYKLNLDGPSVVVQSACSTSLVAVHLACRALLSGECDLALAGGVSLKFPQKEGYLFQEGSIASPDGHCRAFDAAARGTVNGNGVGLVVLKRLEEALADRDTIHAVIRGSAINNDGSHKVSYLAPSVDGQAEVISEAQVIGGVDPATIGYVETHGTGTELGDPIEIAGLNKAFSDSGASPASIAIGSLKTNFGHLNTAAGVAGLIKAVLALENRQLPPSLNFQAPNPGINFAAGPFYVNAKLADWPSNGAPRRAAVSSFGIGGTNAHVVLEEAPQKPEASPSRKWQLLAVSARTPAALDRATQNLADHLEHHPELSLADVAYTGHVGKRAFSQRRIIVSDGRDRAIEALRDPTRSFSGAAGEATVAFLFPGQGSQYAGMGRGLYRDEPTFREWIDRGSELLGARFGFDLREIMYPAVADNAAALRLRQTRFAQPALFITSIALAKLWIEWGIEPEAMLGHSVGEYAAACLAGVFSFEDGLSLVAARGDLIAALPSGSMIAVPLSEAELAPLLEGSGCSLAAVNGPLLCVVSGPTAAIETFGAKLASQEIECRALHTSHAFHSAMMDPALDAFREIARKVSFRAPQIPFVSNVSGLWITAQQATDPEYWARHIREAVRFSAGLETLQTNVFLEVGPGHTLSTLARGSGRVAISSLPPPDAANGEDGEQILRALGRLWIAGAVIDWTGFYSREERSRVPLPSYPFERQRLWPEDRSCIAVTAPKIDAGKKHDIGDWFYTQEWKRSVFAKPREKFEGSTRWLLFEDRQGLAVELEKRLIALGHSVTRALKSDDYSALANVDAVVDLSTLGSDDSDLDAAIDRHFFAVLSLTRAIGQQEAPLRLTVVSNGVYDLSGDEATFPVRSLVLGPCTVVGQEHPQVTARHIDLGGFSGLKSIADQLVEELTSKSADARVAFRGRQRWALGYEPLRIESNNGALLREGGVYLITGGLGRVGRVLAGALASKVKAKLVLVGRTANANHEVVRAIEAQGAEVMALKADVSSTEQMRAAIEQTISRFGALHGIIHAAGVTGDGDPTLSTIAEIDRAACEAQFQTKVRAVHAIQRAIADQPLDFVVLMSSLASALGGVGFAAYAAANLFIDAFVQQRDQQRDPTKWISLNWDAWTTGEEAAAAFGSELAQLAIQSDEGAEAFLRVFSLPDPVEVFISTGDLGARLAKWVNIMPGTGAQKAPLPAGARQPRPQLRTELVLPSNEVEATIADIWKELLGFQEVGIHDDFIELGGHSLLATQAVSRLRKTFRVDLPIRSFVEAPTVAGLALVILQKQAASVAPVKLDELLAELEGLDDAEVEKRLAAQAE